MNKKFSFLVIALLVTASMILAACQPQVVTQEVVVTKEVPVEVEKIVEVPAEPTDKTVIEFWTTDNEEPRVDVYEELAAAFMAEHPEIDLRIVPIEEAGIAQRIATAQAANRLPDIVRMGIERVSTFSADGILDQDAASAVIAAVGEDWPGPCTV